MVEKIGSDERVHQEIRNFLVRLHTIMGRTNRFVFFADIFWCDTYQSKQDISEYFNQY